MLSQILKGARGSTAYYTTDFGEFSTGALVSPWASASGGGNITTDAGTISGKKMRGESADVLYLTTAPPSADVDIFAIVKCLDTSGHRAAGVFGRKTGSTSSVSNALNNTYYAGKVPSANTRSLEYRDNSGAVTFLASNAVTISSTSWFSVRLRLNGTTQQAKVWLYGDPEPTSWQLTGSNTALTVSGLVGLRASFGATANKLECQYFSVAIDGNEPDIII